MKINIEQAEHAHRRLSVKQSKENAEREFREAVLCFMKVTEQRLDEIDKRLDATADALGQLNHRTIGLNVMG